MAGGAAWCFGLVSVYADGLLLLYFTAAPTTPLRDLAVVGVLPTIALFGAVGTRPVPQPGTAAVVVAAAGRRLHRPRPRARRHGARARRRHPPLGRRLVRVAGRADRFGPDERRGRVRVVGPPDEPTRSTAERHRPLRDAAGSRPRLGHARPGPQRVHAAEPPLLALQAITLGHAPAHPDPCATRLEDGSPIGVRGDEPLWWPRIRRRTPCCPSPAAARRALRRGHRTAGRSGGAGRPRPGRPSSWRGCT